MLYELWLNDNLIMISAEEYIVGYLEEKGYSYNKFVKHGSWIYVADSGFRYRERKPN